MNLSEHQNVEWKTIWKDEYLKWICGFANAQGGRIYLGVDNNGNAVGLTNSKKMLEDIPNKVRDVLGIIVDVNLKSEGSHEYIEVIVNSSSYPINYKGEYHYRSGSTKQILKGASLTEFLTSKTGHTWDDVPIDKVAIAELDTDSFEIFRSQAFRNGRMDEQDLDISNEQLLENLGLLQNGKLIRAAILLFHKNPEKFIKGSGIKIGFFKTDADLLYQDEVHGSLFQQAEKIIDILYTKYLKGIIDYQDLIRIEQYPFPKEALREALFNAIIHKNYATQIPVQVSVYEDRLYISNDCVFPPGWTVETLMSKHRSKPYNPNIANGFFRAGLVETWGRGIEKICESCEAQGLENPKWFLYPEDLMVSFTTKQAIKTSDKKQAIKTSDKTQAIKTSDKKQAIKTSDKRKRYYKEISTYFSTFETLTTRDISEFLGLSTTRTRVILNDMVMLGLLEAIGEQKTRKYKMKKM